MRKMKESEVVELRKTLAESEQYVEEFFGQGEVASPSSLKDLNVYSDVVPEYVKGLMECKDWGEVSAHCKKWDFLAQDAVEQVMKARMKYKWPELQKAMSKDGKPAKRQVKDAACIFAPRVLFVGSMLGEEFGVPWGTAFVQSIRAMQILVKDGKAFIPKTKLSPATGMITSIESNGDKATISCSDTGSRSVHTVSCEVPLDLREVMKYAFSTNRPIDVIVLAIDRSSFVGIWQTYGKLIQARVNDDIKEEADVPVSGDSPQG